MSARFSFWTTLLTIVIICAVVLFAPAARAQTGPPNPDNYVCKTVTYPASAAAGGGTDFLYYCQPPSQFAFAGCNGDGSVTMMACTSKCAPPQEKTAYISSQYYVPGLGPLAVPVAVPGPKLSLQIPGTMLAGATYAESVTSDSPGLSTITTSAPAPFTGGTQPDANGSFTLTAGAPEEFSAGC